LENQIEALKKYVEENNWRLVGNKLHLYVVFIEGAATKGTANSSKVYGIDIN